MICIDYHDVILNYYFVLIYHELQDNPAVMGIIHDNDHPHDYLVIILHELQDNPAVMGIIHDTDHPHEI